MRKAVLFLTLLLLSLGLSSCGGGGSGPLALPPGENPGVASLVQLAASQNAAQTGANITLSATVTDGNGARLSGVAVTFTKLTALGVLSTTLPVTTNSIGIATVNVLSSSSGFVTVAAQISAGAGFIRDRRSIFFTTAASATGLAFTPIAVFLDVDSTPGNGLVSSLTGWNEASDVNICSAAGDNVVRLRATVFVGGVLAPGVAVNFTTDSDALAAFPNTPFGTDNDADGDKDIDVVVTNSVGEAFSEVTVNCLVQNNERILNVFAFTDTLFVFAFNGSFSGLGAATLFLQPVTVSGIAVTATPSTVLPGGTSRIDATVSTSSGPISGIAVSFTTSCGTVDPAISQTNSFGVATTTFTAPSTPGPCTVTARVGSVTGSATVTVSTALSVQPSAVTINGTTGGVATFTIFGGVPGYTIATSNPAFPPVPAAVAASGGTFTVTVPVSTPATTVTYTIRDSVGTTVTATLAITTTPLSVTPASASVVSGGAVAFTITGGVPGYTVTINNLLCTPLPASPVAASGGTFTVTTGAGGCTNTASPVTVTVTDSAAVSVSRVITITP